MTELLSRPAPARDAEPTAPARHSVWLRGVTGAVWAAAVGVAALVVVVLVVWAADARSGTDAGTAIRTALQLWLVAHHTPLHLSAATVSVAPLGLTLALAALVARAAAVVARGSDVDDGWGVATVTVAVGVPYAVAATFD